MSSLEVSFLASMNVCVVDPRAAHEPGYVLDFGGKLKAYTWQPVDAEKFLVIAQDGQAW